MVYTEGETAVQGLTGQKGRESMEEEKGLGRDGGLISSKDNDMFAASDQDGGERDPHLVTTEARPSAAPYRPLLVPLGPSTAPPSTSSTPTPQPHPKRFSAVNINKKFLEKNAVSSSSLPPVSNTIVSKPGTPACGLIPHLFVSSLIHKEIASRPATQPSSSHPKLVTAKLTGASTSSTATGSGWSRPSSATPPVPAGLGGASNTPNSLSNGVGVSGQGGLQHAGFGKVIQPQPRAAVATTVGLPDKPNSSRPVWGNVKTLANASNRLDIQDSSNFPTAAEVAQGKFTLHSKPITD